MAEPCYKHFDNLLKEFSLAEWKSQHSEVAVANQIWSKDINIQPPSLPSWLLHLRPHVKSVRNPGPRLTPTRQLHSTQLVYFCHNGLRYGSIKTQSKDHHTLGSLPLLQLQTSSNGFLPPLLLYLT